MNGIPHRKESHDDDRQKDKYHICGMNTHRIGIDNKRALRGAKANNAELLL